MLSRMRHLGVVVSAALAVLALTGCSASIGEKLDVYPQELIDNPGNGEMTPTVVWSDDGEHWLVLSFGSSSCPWEPRELTEPSPNSYEIRIEKTGGPFCSADFEPTVHSIPTPVIKGTEVTVDLGPGTKITM